MTETATMDKPLVTLSDSAASRIAEILKDEDDENLMLRVSVSGGGCSGFQYGFSFDDTRSEDDLVIEKNGVTVLVDSMSLLYMSGAEIDFVEDLIGSSFQIKNPNATAQCGCGSSFSV
jgi:iron-sulfur cluster insertion protein